MGGDCRVVERDSNADTCLSARASYTDSEDTKSNICVLISDNESKKECPEANNKGITVYEDQTQPEDASEQDGKEAITSYAKVPPTLIPPDGGWGWLVAFGVFITMTLLFSVVSSFSLLYSSFLEDQGTSNATKSWIFNVQLCLWFVIGPVVKPLCTEFGYRRVGFFGVSLVSLGIFLSAYAPTAGFLFFSFSTLTGVGGGLATTVCYLILPTYFDKRRGAANTLLFSGICMGQIIGAPLVDHLVAAYNFKGAAMIYGGIILLCWIGVAFFHPLKWHLKRSEDVSETPDAVKTTSDDDERNPPGALTEDMKSKTAKKMSRLSESSHISSIKKGSDDPSLPNTEAVKERSSLWQIIKRVCRTSISDLRALSSMRALLINVGLALSGSSYFNFVMLVQPRIEKDAGFTSEDAALCISIMGICNFVIRLIISPLTDRPKFSMRACFMAGYAIIAVGILAFPFLNDLNWIKVAMAVTGCGVAANVTLNTLIMIKYMGLEKFPSVFGASCLLMGISFILLAPTIGLVQDATNNYKISIGILSGMNFCSFFLWFLMPVAVAYDAKRDAKSRQAKQDTQSV